MGLHSDLIALAERAVAAANEATAKGSDAVHLAQTAKTALEGAALAVDVKPGEVDQMMGALRDELRGVGLDPDAEPVEVLRSALSLLKAWQGEVAKMDAHERAFERLRETVALLINEFEKAGTPTATRIAGRLVAAYDEAAEIVRKASE